LFPAGKENADPLEAHGTHCGMVVPRRGFSWERGRFNGALFRANWRVGYGVV
jgi:hypothetical protein